MKPLRVALLLVVATLTSVWIGCSSRCEHHMTSCLVCVHTITYRDADSNIRVVFTIPCPGCANVHIDNCTEVLSDTYTDDGCCSGIARNLGEGREQILRPMA